MSTTPTALDIIAPRPIKPKYTPLSRGNDAEKILTKKQKLFVEYYLQKDNAYQAAIKAGYSESTAITASTSILESPPVIREIRRRTDETFKELEINTNWVLEKAQELASANMLDYVDIQEDGNFKVNLNRVNKKMGAAIQELSYGPDGKPRIRLVDKKAAVELLARIMKLMGSGSDEGGKGDSGPITLQYLDKIVQNVTVNNFQQAVPQEQLPETIEAR